MPSITHKVMTLARTRNSAFFASLREIFLAFAILLFTGVIANAEDGYRLWLRYDPLPQEAIASYRPRIGSIVVLGNSAPLAAIRAESDNGFAGLLGTTIKLQSKVDRHGVIVP